MQPLSAQEAFWNWATQTGAIAVGLLLAICLAVVVAVFASNRDKERSRDD